MNREFQKACVTGGAGFIGSRLAAALVHRGIEVVILDDLSVGLASNVPQGARLIRGSILDKEKVAEALMGCEILFHLAARVSIRSSFEFVVEDTTLNVVGMASLLRSAHEAGSVRKVLTASSMAVYADSLAREPVTELHPTAPVSPYGASKLCAEHLTHQICGKTGMRSVVLRLFNTYGPGQRYSPYVGVITIFCHRLASGERPTIYGDGEQVRDFVHVDDVVQGVLRAMESDISGETFNIGTGVPRSVNHVLQHLQREFGTSLVAHYDPPVTGELRHSIADISKARRLLGYEPTHAFESSIGVVVREIISQRMTVAQSP